MFRMSSLRIVTSAPILALGLLALLALASPAAAQSCGGGTVAPGDTVCIQPVSFDVQVTASGSSMKEVSFAVTDLVSGVTKTIFANTGSTGFLQSWDATDNPKLFPGTFKICATRGSGHTDAATVLLCISGS